MTYTQVSETVIGSAISTLEIIDRKARQDTARLVQTTYSAYIKLSSPEAQRKYQIAREVVGRLAEIAWLVILAVSNDLRRWVDAEVAACLPQEVAPEDMPVDDSLCVESVVELSQDFGESHEPVATVEPQPESSNDTVEQHDPVPARGGSNATGAVRRGNAGTTKGKARAKTPAAKGKGAGTLSAS